MSEDEAEPQPAPGFPAGLAALIAQAGQPAAPRPVERWTPPDCGDIDMRVGVDGTWYYMGTPIGRDALVRLFASILRREPDGRYVLVTPVEKVGIRVDDAPFLAVEMAAAGEGGSRRLTLRTNVGDIVEAGFGHPIRFEIESETGGLKPYVTVRGGLDARFTRSLAQELVALAEARDGASGILSGGAFFPFPAFEP